MIDLEEQLNFTNKFKHPSNQLKVVYRHIDHAQADHFGNLLSEAGIDFEKQIDDSHEKQPVYFGVAKHHERTVDRLNFIALGIGRPKFISSAPVRWLIIVISIFVLGLAILGALLS
jgi:hypothetical protein